MKIINLTPHRLNLLVEGGEIAIPPSGDVARVEKEPVALDPIQIDGYAVPVVRIAPAAVGITGLPAPQPGVIYVVSEMVARAAARPDVLSPGPLVRDDLDGPVGCRGLRAATTTTTPQERK